MASIFSKGKNNVNFGKKGVDSHKYEGYDYYKDKPMYRHHFKDACKRKDWNFNDFEEVFMGTRKIGNGTNVKLYTYHYKKDINL